MNVGDRFPYGPYTAEIEAVSRCPARVHVHQHGSRQALARCDALAYAFFDGMVYRWFCTDSGRHFNTRLFHLVLPTDQARLGLDEKGRRIAAYLAVEGVLDMDVVQKALDRDQAFRDSGHFGPKAAAPQVDPAPPLRTARMMLQSSNGAPKAVGMVNLGRVPNPNGLRGGKYELVLATYGNGRVAVIVTENGQPHTKVSINVVEVDLAPGEFVVNHDVLPFDRIKRLARVLSGEPRFTSEIRQQRVFEQMVAASGHIVDTGRRCSYGNVDSQPIYRLSDEALSKFLTAEQPEA